jgi:hypothetical protein
MARCALPVHPAKRRAWRKAIPSCQPSKDGDVHTNKTDDRKFISIKVASNGRIVCRKIYLKTTDHRLAHPHARALERIEDPDRARRVVAYVASAKTPGQEQDRLADLTDTAPEVVANLV